MFGPTTLFRIFDNEPSLHSLHLQSFHQQLRLPFQKIEKLEIVDHFTHFSDLLLLLLQCSHLKMLDISFSGTVNDGLDELSLLTMEHLSSLKLFSLNEFTGFIEVISCIVCPMLTALLLNFDDSDYDRNSGSPHNMSVERFNSFLQRSACQISTLELSGTSRLFFVDNNLTQFLQALPTVRDFTLSLDTFYPEGSGENYLQRLTFVEPPISEMSRTSTLLPQLQSFRLRLEEKTPCFFEWGWDIPPSLGLPDAEAIFSMVHSRRLMHASPGVERLIHFELSFEATRYSFGVPWVNNFHSTVEPRLRVLENEGLSLSLNLKVPNGPEPCSFDCSWSGSEDL
ncbi:hypothetical protein VKT23_004805 [Stygiomarasmius scandens]|uniref:Uncharacterized protein n=1 Tax=Marasmiellus scandens TaxID=2682957 RepID=A0ABR1JX63_9AGAR